MSQECSPQSCLCWRERDIRRSCWECVGRFYLKSPVKFHHHVCKVDPLSPSHKLSDLRMVVGTDVVAHKVPVDAVSAAFLLVQENIRG